MPPISVHILAIGNTGKSSKNLTYLSEFPSITRRPSSCSRLRPKVSSSNEGQSVAETPCPRTQTLGLSCLLRLGRSIDRPSQVCRHQTCPWGLPRAYEPAYICRLLRHPLPSGDRVDGT